MPYSWDDQNDFSADSQKGYSFHSARKTYKDVAVAQTRSEAFYTYKSPFLKTDAAYPLIIGIDTTGSMSEWPAIFFEKLPLLYKETIKYFPGCEISFQAINDFEADGVDVALQPAPFGKGPQLDEFIGQLYPVGGGGGQVTESYEIFAAYNSFVDAPKAIIKPVAIILGDEAPFDNVPEEVSQSYGFSKSGSVPAGKAFKELHKKCDVFLVRKAYYAFGEQDAPIVNKWLKMGGLSRERILNINEPRRVVDVILGILGILTGKTELFEKELVLRQEPAQVQEVLTSLKLLKKTYHRGLGISQNSVTIALDDATQKTKGLKTDE